MAYQGIEPRLVRIRSQRLLACWGASRSVAMAQRYVVEARRSGSRAAADVAEAVLRDLQVQLAAGQA